MAAAALHNQYASALEEALASSSSDDFLQGFNLAGEHGGILTRTHGHAVTLLRSNVLVRRGRVWWDLAQTAPAPPSRA